MMNRSLIVILVASVFLWIQCSENNTPKEIRSVKPDIFPDYTGVTIPATIAPLNFKIKGEFTAVEALIEGKNSSGIKVNGSKYIHIPPDKWSALLAENKGDSIRVTVSAKQESKWIQFAPFSIYVSAFPIDYGLVYRLIAPGYEIYSKMGIYQRNLSTFEQTPIIENTLVPGSCVNCHSFRLTDPANMSLHLRGKKGGTLLMADGKVKLLNTKTPKTLSNFIYPYWHPSGRYIAYSVNNIKQIFHESQPKRVEVVDFASDIVVYDVRKNQTICCNKLMSDSIFETFPSFSPDGKSLYFCSARSKKMPSSFKEVRYNLCRISFNPEDGTFGDQVDTLVNAAAMGKSVTFPRPSPDGRYILFTLIDYGNFSIWHKEADLYLFDVQTAKCRALNEVNSRDTESYHSWSSNSRWFVFSSRRIDGLYTRPFIAQIDENGKVGKPFLLPQENPDHQDALLYSYNVPEFVSGRVDLDISQVENLIKTSGTNVTQRE